jgi:hypothetical protein
MRIRSENDTLRCILRKFYKELKYTEKIFLFAYLIEMIVYTLLVITYLSLTVDFVLNCPVIIVIIFPIISGIIMVSIIYLQVILSLIS